MNKNNHPEFICTLITVKDIAVSRNFYERILGQKIKHDFGENISFESGFALHLRPHFSELIDGKTVGVPQNNTEFYFEADDVDSVAEILRVNRIEFVHEMREQPWRQMVVRVYDPDRYIVEIGESMEHCAYRLFLEGKTVDEISGITNMPVKFVDDAVKSYL